MRSYFYIEAADPKLLDKLPGCRFVADSGRGNGPELWCNCHEPFEPSDYPSRVHLVHALPGTRFLQVAPLVDDGGALLKLVTDNAAKAGLVVYPDAKSLAASQPLTAETHLYEQRAKLDARGKPTGATERKTGAPLQVAAVLAGDDPVAHADPSKVVEPVRAIR